MTNQQMTISSSTESKSMYSLFLFAPHEMSHSAYWAWILNTLNVSDLETLAGPRRIAQRLLDKAGIQDLKTPVKVEVEKPTQTKLRGERGRYDIYVEDSRGTVFVIENKVSAIPDKRQLDRFLKDLESLGRRAHLALLSTAFDADVRAFLPLNIPYIGIADLLKIIYPDQSSHALVHDYYLWLSDLAAYRSDLENDALSDDPKRVAKALAGGEGQWALMRELTIKMTGRQYRGKNIGGSLWTQFRFIEEKGAPDVLFYRIDSSKKGAYLSIRQYQANPSPVDPQSKWQRLLKLRNLWSQAIAEAGKDLKPGIPRDRGKKESEIGYFLLADNPPKILREELPTVHEAFLRRLGYLH